MLSLFGFDHAIRTADASAEVIDARALDEVDLSILDDERSAHGEERRRAPRTVLPRGAAGTTATGHLVELLNVSPGGLLLRSVHPVRSGERHRLRVPDAELGCVTFDVNVIHAQPVAESWGEFVLAGVEMAE